MDLYEALLFGLLLGTLVFILVSTYIFQQRSVDYGIYITPFSNDPYYRPPVSIIISILLGISLILYFKKNYE